MPVTWVEWVETDIVTCSGLQAQRLPAAIPTLPHPPHSVYSMMGDLGNGPFEGSLPGASVFQGNNQKPSD